MIYCNELILPRRQNWLRFVIFKQSKQASKQVSPA